MSPGYHYVLCPDTVKSLSVSHTDPPVSKYSRLGTSQVSLRFPPIFCRAELQWSIIWGIIRSVMLESLSEWSVCFDLNNNNSKPTITASLSIKSFLSD